MLVTIGLQRNNLVIQLPLAPAPLINRAYEFRNLSATLSGFVHQLRATIKPMFSIVVILFNVDGPSRDQQTACAANLQGLEVTLPWALHHQSSILLLQNQPIPQEPPLLVMLPLDKDTAGDDDTTVVPAPLFSCGRDLAKN